MYRVLAQHFADYDSIKWNWFPILETIEFYLEVLAQHFADYDNLLMYGFHNKLAVSFYGQAGSLLRVEFQANEWAHVASANSTRFSDE